MLNNDVNLIFAIIFALIQKQAIKSNTTKRCFKFTDKNPKTENDELSQYDFNNFKENIFSYK